MYGAIFGDIAGSLYEFSNNRTPPKTLTEDRSFFTDDTVHCIAVGHAIRDWLPFQEKPFTHIALAHLQDDVSAHLKGYSLRYPTCSYGSRFREWMVSKRREPYNSCGNGSAMRVAAISLATDNIEEAKQIAAYVSYPTHNHPEGIVGAQCVASLATLARTGATWKELLDCYYTYYDELYTVGQLRAYHQYTELCRETVIAAMSCFFGTTTFDECITSCISIGGDADTLACIAGSVAEAFYGFPSKYVDFVRSKLPEELLAILDVLQPVRALRQSD